MYCSFEARKVLDALAEYGIEIDEDEYIQIEQCVGRFWNTHIIKIIKQVITPKSIDRAAAQGWSYVEKPILSMLTPRHVAHRTDTVEFEITDTVRYTYQLIARVLCLTDFNMTELALIVNEIPPLVTEGFGITDGIAACKKQGVRTPYYLHGVLRREYQTRQGRIKEIQQQSAEGQGWSVPDDFERMDITERRELDADWLDKLNDIAINKALNVFED